jgi:muconolactone D-isomerase
VSVPEGASDADAQERFAAEAAAASSLADEGHLLRIWRRPGPDTVLGLYRADSRSELDGLLQALPLHDWMRIDVTPLESHPNDPAPAHR